MQDATNLHAPVLGAGVPRAARTAAPVARGAVTLRERLVLGAALILLALAFQGSRAIYESDEGRYTDIALTMLDSHDWLVPHVDQEHAFYTKPPLTYWAVAASFAAFGRNAWAARLPNALAFVATGLLVLGLARRFVPAHPWLGAAAWAAMLGPTAAANVVSTDTLLALWETLAMYAWTRAVSAEPREHPAWIVVMWLAWGLAMLTKGPVGLLPLVALLCALAIARDTSGLRAIFNPAGLACFVAVGLGWYLAVIALRPHLLGYFLGYETYDRIFTAVHGRHPQWYGALETYVPALALGALPWTGLLLRRRRSARSAVTGAIGAGDADRALLLWWLLLPLAVFAVSRSRLPLYVLPLFVPLALLVARVAATNAPRLKSGPLVIAASIWLAVLVALKGVAAHYPAPLESDARAFAAQLSRTVALQNFDEITFVDTPIYGLRLYLERNVERIALQPTAGPYASFTAPEALCDELRHRERTLYLVHDDHRRSQFGQAVRSCGAYTANVIGSVDDFAALTVVETR